MALFALLFALTPSLEAANCAGEGLGFASSDGGVSVASVSSSDASDNCAAEACVCAVCQCGHGVSFAATIAMADKPLTIDRGPRGESERLASTISHGFERPPRA